MQVWGNVVTMQGQLGDYVAHLSPPARFMSTGDIDELVTLVWTGVLFIHARWSEPSSVALERLTGVLRSMGGAAPTLSIVDTDLLCEQALLYLIGRPYSEGTGEACILVSGSLRYVLHPARPIADEEIASWCRRVAVVRPRRL